MKKLLLFSLISICLATASAQVINVPSKAQKHFLEKYVGASEIDWTNSVVSYVAKFKMGNDFCKAHYKIDGTWDYTEKFISKDSIPAPAKESFSKSKYREWEVKTVAICEYPKKAKLVRIEAHKGISTTYVYFDKDGNLVKTSATL